MNDIRDRIQKEIKWLDTRIAHHKEEAEKATAYFRECAAKYTEWEIVNTIEARVADIKYHKDKVRQYEEQARML